MPPTLHARVKRMRDGSAHSPLAASQLTNLSRLFVRHPVIASLKELRLMNSKYNYYDTITDDGLAIVATTLQQLRYLEITNYDTITDDGLAIVATTLQQLRYLEITNCDRITDAGLKCISALQQLRHLNVALCDNITDTGLAPSLAVMQRLRHLDLGDCYKISETLALP
ncbi:receptor-type protein kinase, putative [Bodo saltans]|uniref:Receptor-type protein kinase, putative n=1 Tax=Bodo saltans TaxID=75058 RepID=A0A0S4IHG1_BODSA|nr:receptor-type protein kinase, putative [Bodo saltans]|eukprot:CUE64581.1 receptor-type protein kinase, putative [Bodo saltans]